MQPAAVVAVQRAQGRRHGRLGLPRPELGFTHVVRGRVVARAGLAGGLQLLPGKLRSRSIRARMTGQRGEGRQAGGAVGFVRVRLGRSERPGGESLEAPLLPEREGDLADPVLLDGVGRGEAGGQGVLKGDEVRRWTGVGWAGWWSRMKDFLLNPIKDRSFDLSV